MGEGFCRLIKALTKTLIYHYSNECHANLAGDLSGPPDLHLGNAEAW